MKLSLLKDVLVGRLTVAVDNSFQTAMRTATLCMSRVKKFVSIVVMMMMK